MAMMRNALFVQLLILLTMCGCGGSEPLKTTDMKLYPVTGRVVVGKQPVPGATVQFKPKFEWNKEIQHPHATTGADGQYELETVMSDDGAPAGDYEVSITFGEAAGGSANSSYADPSKSGLKATVKASPTQVPDFVLKPGSVKVSTNSRSSKRD